MSRNGEVVVDGVVYRWALKYWEDPEAGSLSFSRRGIDNSYYFVEIHSDGASPITFDFPDRSQFSDRWWKGKYRNDATDEDIIRAVRIARRNSTSRLTGDDLDEVLGWPANELETVTAELRKLALGELASDELLVRCLISIGVSKPKLRVVLTDWIASIDLAAARPRLQALLDQGRELRLERRSAFQFLMELCAEAGVEFSIDTAAFDQALKKGSGRALKPFAMPHEHWWWNHGSLRYIDPHDN